MAFDLKSYLLGKQDKPLVGAYDLPSWLMGKTQSGDTKTLTGVPPFMFVSDGSNLVDWSISGNTGGVGEKTKNYAKVETRTTSEGGVTFTFDHTTGTITANGTATGSAQCRVYFNAPPGYESNSTVPPGNYYFSATPTGGGNDTYNCYSWDYDTGARSKRWDGTTSVEQDNGQGSCQVQINGHRQTITMRIATGYTANNVVFKPMLRAADTDAVFIPYGYEVPVTCGGSTTNIFIGDSPLSADDTVSKTSTGADIPTTDGSNTLTVGTTVQPSSMTITYKKG